ncbi:hypothetical protein DOY81_011787 [Sarcophaga bullata]|nr:hypothetical protein DOY81_011787 [Sarcophaga bullata]
MRANVSVFAAFGVGNNSERQLSSAECLCNLSLGEAPVCEKIASMAGSYLVTYIHTTESQLVRLSLWTLANILSTSHKGGLILMQMQLLPQLWKLYVDDSVADDLSDFREDSAICLQLMALNSDLLRNVDMQQLSSVWHINLAELFNNLFSIRNHNLTQEVLWFLKNVLHLENTIPLNQDYIVEKINISKMCVASLDQSSNEKSMALVILIGV